MEVLKVIQNTNSSEDYLYNAISYIINKTEAVCYDGYRVDPNNAYEQMMLVKRYFSKTSGNQLVHMILNSVSFTDGKMFAEGKGEFAKFAEYIGKITRSRKCRVVYGGEE